MLNNTRNVVRLWAFLKKIQKSICQIPFRRAIGPPPPLPSCTLMCCVPVPTTISHNRFTSKERRGERDRERETDRQLTKKSYIASKSHSPAHSSEYNSGSLPVICKGSQPCTEGGPDWSTKTKETKLSLLHSRNFRTRKKTFFFWSIFCLFRVPFHFAAVATTDCVYPT